MNVKHHNIKHQIIGISAVNLSTFVWSTNIILGRWLKDSIGPITLSTIRFFIASMIFIVILRQQRQKEKLIGDDFWLLLGMAVTGVVLFSPMLYLGLHYTTAANSILINGISPLLTCLFGALLINETITRKQVTGAIIALLGVVILISDGSLAFWQTARFNTGDLIVLGAVCLWALYSVISRKVTRNRSPISTTALSTFTGLPILLILSLFEIRIMPVNMDSKTFLSIIYIGIFPAAIGFYSWNVGVSRLGSSGAMVFYNTLPIYGIILSFFFLGEDIDLHHIIGGLFILIGGIWAALESPLK